MARSRVNNHEPLVISPTGAVGLVEFQRTGCRHEASWGLGACPECVEHARRRQLVVALRRVESLVGRGGVTPKARIGQTYLDAGELRELLAELDRYDADLGRRGAA